MLTVGPGQDDGLHYRQVDILRPAVGAGIGKFNITGSVHIHPLHCEGNDVVAAGYGGGNYTNVPNSERAWEARIEGLPQNKSSATVLARE